MQGQVTAAGSKVLQDAPPAHSTAPAVARLQAAGLIMVRAACSLCRKIALLHAGFTSAIADWTNQHDRVRFLGLGSAKPAAALDWVTHAVKGLNPHFGTPRSCYGRTEGLGRIPGGSSSGAAVSVAEGMAHAALGSDTGGSVRIPV